MQDGGGSGISLAGQLGGVLIVAIPLAILVTLLLLLLYRRAVKRSMMHHSGAATPEEAAAPVDAGRSGIALRIIETSGDVAAGSSRWTGALAPNRWSAAAVYIVAGVACAIVLTVLYLVANNFEFLIRRFLFIALSSAWPVVLTTIVVAAVSRREMLAIVAGYWIAFIGLTALVKGEATWFQALLFWGITNGPPTVLILLFLARRIRAVGPLVLAFMIAAVGGATVATGLIGSDQASINRFADGAKRLGLGADVAFFLMMGAGAIALGLVGWLLLLAIGRLYRARRISDQSIVLDSIWFMFILAAGIQLTHAAPWWFLVSFLAFAVYKLIAIVGFRILERNARSERVPQLLLLRVFSLGKRSERLFDAFGKLWRYRGGIRLIAGPDLVTSTVEPHEFLDFLTGKLARRFITGKGTLERRIAESDVQRDFDTRYRVNDFFCHDDTWKMVLERLALESDAILMDLRGFTPQNQGCVYEINELFGKVDLARVLFVVDTSTDQEFLTRTFAQCWSAVDARSPNLKVQDPAARIFRLGRKESDGVAALAEAVSFAARAT